MHTITAEISASNLSLNRGANVWMRRNKTTLKAKLTGHEKVGAKVVFRSDEPNPEKREGRVVAVEGTGAEGRRITIEADYELHA